jgi:hypothetical protein
MATLTQQPPILLPRVPSSLLVKQSEEILAGMRWLMTWEGVVQLVASARGLGKVRGDIAGSYFADFLSNQQRRMDLVAAEKVA